MRTTLRATVCAVAAVAMCAIAAGPAAASGEPSNPVPVSIFATQYQGCAGPLRSAIANGSLDGVTVGTLTIPAGFSQSFNPGDHTGSTDELAFLIQQTGLTLVQLQALCALFTTH